MLMLRLLLWLPSADLLPPCRFMFFVGFLLPVLLTPSL